MAENQIKSYDFESDPRTPCKYGSNCYQINKIHKEKFKHPIVDEDEDCTNEQETPNKKQKIDSKYDFLPNRTKQPMNSTSPKKVPVVKNVEKKDSITYSSLKEKVRLPDSKQLNLKTDIKELIKQLFLVEMPADFYSFWEMCKSLNENDPLNALKAVKLKLVGPFDVLAGKITEVYEEDLPDFLRHWRYYYDPPELQTVLASESSTCYHLGYYRDDPKEMPIFVASSNLNTKNPEKNGELKIIGQNLFVALNAYLEDLKTDPFSRMKIPKLQNTLVAWTKEKGFSLEKNSKIMDSRSRKVVAKTFHGAGIVVPVDKKNDVGYRELAATNSMLKRILKGIVDSKSDEEKAKYWEQLQPVVTFANIANDECDFGTSLELGLDLFTSGSPLFHQSVKQMLGNAYNLLGRMEFMEILEAHLKNRKHGGKLSIL